MHRFVEYVSILSLRHIKNSEQKLKLINWKKKKLFWEKYVSDTLMICYFHYIQEVQKTFCQVCDNFFNRLITTHKRKFRIFDQFLFIPNIDVSLRIFDLFIAKSRATKACKFLYFSFTFFKWRIKDYFIIFWFISIHFNVLCQLSPSCINTIYEEI